MDKKSINRLEFNIIKEKLSEYALSAPGRELIGELQPSDDIDVVVDRLNETRDGVNMIMRCGSPGLSGIHDIRGAAARLRLSGILNNPELLAVASVLGVCRSLKRYASAKAAESPEENTVAALISRLEPHRETEERIRDVVLSEDEIADTASPLLNTLRRQIRDKQDSIRTTLNNIINSPKYKKAIQDGIITMRGDRFVIPVKQEYRNEFKGIVHDMSSSGATLFVEPMNIVEINNDIRQLKVKEAIEIERILYELCAGLTDIISSIESNIAILTQLDFIFAKARLGVELKGCCPAVNDTGIMTIKRGRHPLIDPKTVVPIDLWIGRDFKILVVTGPNTGGKTVTLKTAGLFALMAQSGLYLPADDGTEMPIYDNVFADIGDEQSIEQSLSTFSSHMTNIVEIMKRITPRSLVLFDELGAGTDPSEGAALAMSILEELLHEGATAIATTHYTELKLFALNTPGVENASCEFDVETLRPTFRILIGLPGKSNAFAISKRLGLDESLIGRAGELLSNDEIRFEDLLLNVEQNRRKAESDKLAAEADRNEAAKLRAELQASRADIETRKEEIFRRSREEARDIVKRARAEVSEIIDALRRLGDEQDDKIRNTEAEKLRLRLKKQADSIDEKLSDYKPEFMITAEPHDFKPGDTVFLINLKQKGTIASAPDKEGNVQVQVGVIKVKANVNELIYDDAQKVQTSKIVKKISGDVKVRSVKTELDLRGLTIEAGEAEMDRFLDSAAIAGMHEVRVIHGKGTGALRSGIHRYLKSHPHVKAYRLGLYGEGDSGVTVIELKT